MNRRRFIATLAAGGAVLAAHPAGAGGWVTVEWVPPVSALPIEKPVTVGILVLAHGKTPVEEMVSNVAPVLTLIHRESVAEQSFDAVRTEVPGVYAIELLIDEPGEYNAGVEVPPFPEIALPPITGGAAPFAGNERRVLSSGTENEVETDILDGSFAEPVLDVPVGTTVTWVNTSVIPHTVTFRDLNLDDSVLLQQDDTFSTSSAESGEFDYYCSPHPYMTGTVRVGMDNA